MITKFITLLRTNTTGGVTSCGYYQAQVEMTFTYMQ